LDPHIGCLTQGCEFMVKPGVRQSLRLDCCLQLAHLLVELSDLRLQRGNGA
jgi:hypothetical protein